MNLMSEVSDIPEGWTCCFCAEGIEPNDSLAVRALLTNLRHGASSNWPMQEVYAHAACMSERLVPAVMFEAERLAEPLDDDS